MANAAPEWQAGTIERKQGVGGSLTTRGVCSASIDLLQQLNVSLTI